MKEKEGAAAKRIASFALAMARDIKYIMLAVCVSGRKAASCSFSLLP